MLQVTYLAKCTKLAIFLATATIVFKIWKTAVAAVNNFLLFFLPLARLLFRPWPFCRADHEFTPFSVFQRNPFWWRPTPPIEDYSTKLKMKSEPICVDIGVSKRKGREREEKDGKKMGGWERSAVRWRKRKDKIGKKMKKIKK